MISRKAGLIAKLQTGEVIGSRGQLKEVGDANRHIVTKTALRGCGERAAISHLEKRDGFRGLRPCVRRRRPRPSDDQKNARHDTFMFSAVKDKSSCLPTCFKTRNSKGSAVTGL